MASAELQKYQAFVQMLERLLTYVGLWPVESPSFFYRILPIITWFLCVGASIVIFNFVWIYHTNIEIMTKGMGLGASFLTTILKIICFTIYRNGVKELRDTLSKLFNDLVNDEIMQSVIMNEFTILRKLSNALAFLIFVSVQTYAIIPPIHVIVQLIHHVRPISLILALPAEYPWIATDNVVMFGCHFMFEVLSGYSLFFVTTGVDALFPVFTFQMISVLKSLSHKLINLKDGDDYNRIVRECVMKYEKLLRCRDLIEKIYGPIVLWLALTSAIVLCAISFQASKLDSFAIDRIAFVIAYIGSKMMQTFIYAWSGSILTAESENFAEAIYASNWPGTGKKKFMTSILIMLSQKSLVITACNYTAVSIDIFIVILNTTVSYFFLLKTLEDKNIE